MIEKQSLSKFDRFLISLVLILANLRATIFVYLSPDLSVLFGPAWIEIMLWVLVGTGFAYLLHRDHLVSAYFSLWRGNWLLILFILLAIISFLWSVGPVFTLFRVLELVFATLIAAYFGLRFDPEQLMEMLFWFGAGVFMLSIALVFAAPPTGTMYWKPFYGAWRGLYWHRNHLASIAAFLNIIYLCRLWLAFQARNNKGILDAFFYLVSLIVLYGAKSATGYILFIVLHVFALGVFVWFNISHRLQRQHYILMLGAIVLFAFLILSNLDFVFGLFNRDATMTGRVSLWIHLLEIGSQRAWFGHGWGAVWNFDWFREQIRLLDGWASQPLIGDNGFLDIFLHLGITGLLLFLGVFMIAVVRSFRYALKDKTLLSFFPLLVMVYAFFANIPFSLFAETEVFVWFLIVAVLFMTTPSAVPTTA